MKLRVARLDAKSAPPVAIALTPPDFGQVPQRRLKPNVAIPVSVAEKPAEQQEAIAAAGQLVK